MNSPKYMKELAEMASRPPRVTTVTGKDKTTGKLYVAGYLVENGFSAMGHDVTPEEAAEHGRLYGRSLLKAYAVADAMRKHVDCREKPPTCGFTALKIVRRAGGLQFISPSGGGQSVEMGALIEPIKLPEDVQTIIKKDV